MRELQLIFSFSLSLKMYTVIVITLYTKIMYNSNAKILFACTLQDSDRSSKGQNSKPQSKGKNIQLSTALGNRAPRITGPQVSAGRNSRQQDFNCERRYSLHLPQSTAVRLSDSMCTGHYNGAWQPGSTVKALAVLLSSFYYYYYHYY